MSITIPIYSEQPLTADAQRIINEVLKDYPKGIFDFWDAQNPPYRPTPIWDKVLVFGSGNWQAHVVGMGGNTQVIHTYSMAQIVTKANAVSVLKAAFNQFYLPQKKHPMRPVYGPFSRFDVTQPMTVDIETSGNLDVSTPEQVGIISMSFYQNGKWASWHGADHVHNAFCNGKCKRRVDDMVFSDADKAILASIENAIWHNGKFDRRVIEARTGVRMSSYFDTMLAHHVLNQAAGDHKLKHLCRQYLGAPEWESLLGMYTVGGAFYENITLDILKQYNGMDVYWTWELWQYLEALLFADEQAFKAYLLETAAADMLMEVEQHGFAIDVRYGISLAANMAIEVNRRLQSLQSFAGNLGFVSKSKQGGSFNPGSWQQVQQVLTLLRGTPYTDKTDEKTLTKLVQAIPVLPGGLYLSPADSLTVRFISDLLEYRGITKSLSTFVQGPLDKAVNGRVHTTFLIHGTSTGRLSSTGPNLQNIPRDKKIRSLYIG